VHSRRKKCDVTWFHSLIGGLNYLASCTRPDVAYSVNVLARRMSNPSKQHAQLLPKFLKYVISTAHTGLSFAWKETPINLVLFSDASLGGLKMHLDTIPYENPRSTS
jgi:uncharacterized protein (DUF2126 family)